MQSPPPPPPPMEPTGKVQTHGGRITPFVVLTCAVAASGGVLFGYDLGISGGVTSMEPFLREFFPAVYAKVHEKRSTAGTNYCRFDSQLLTAFTSSLYIAGLFASLCASPVTRALGRRASMLFGGAAFMAGAALGGLALNVYMLILARVLLGVGVGFTNQAVPLYLSEMAPPRHRGAVNNAFDFFIGLGILGANLINYGTQRIRSHWGWRISLSLAIIPATVLAAGSVFLPETPNSILQRSTSQASVQTAAQTLRKIRGTDDVQDELDDMIAAAKVSNVGSFGSFAALLRPEYRPQLVLVVLIPFFKQMTGITVITFYSPVIFSTIGLAERSSLLSTVIVSAISVGSILGSMLMVDRLGRRTLFFAGGALMLASHLVAGSALAAELRCAYAVLVATCVFVAGFGTSWGPLGWLVPSEVVPLEVRSAGQSVVVAVTLLLAAVNGQSLLAMLCRFKSGVFFYFAGWVVAMTVFVAAMVPETKGVPIERMDSIWKQHRIWKRFVVKTDHSFN
ncbi:hexose carrier protein HEX6-like [Curcuma longa]|uniref:hexose carrier protein HEX6-like n=1 Tax=Curcuma longa TaxID=136217 RepID=UPI003D9FA25F